MSESKNNVLKVVYEGHSPANKEWAEYNSKLRYAAQYIIDKYGKNHAWTMIGGKWDHEKKGINFTILNEKDEEKQVYVSYENICKEFWWKSFVFDKNKISVFPIPYSLEEKEAIVAPSVAKGKKILARQLKEMAQSEVSEEKIEDPKIEDLEKDEDLTFTTDGL